MRIGTTLALAVLAFLAGIKVDAQTRASFKACVERASSDSSYYPQKLDKNTTILGVSCRQEGNRVIYIYENQVGNQLGKLLGADMEKQKAAVRNVACTDPSLKSLLQIVDMEYKYYDSDRVFIGKVTNRIEDCAGVKASQSTKEQDTSPKGSVDKKHAELIRNAKVGNANAQYNLGVAYSLGDGVPKDETKAIEWFQKAADQKVPQALFQLGLKYLLGRSVQKDETKGFVMIRQASELGVAEAQHTLGTYYSHGEGGLPKDPVKGTEWLQKAAAQGIADAQVALGVNYATGQGVNRDMVRAYAWFSLAAAQGDKNAMSNRDRAEKMLTTEQRISGQKYIANWKYGEIF